MKKLLLILMFMPVMLLAQTYHTNSLNTYFKGYIKFPAERVKVGNQDVTQIKILNWDIAATELNDTTSLLTAIGQLPFLNPPHLTTAVIATLSELTNPTWVYDIDRGIFVYWNGTEWRDMSSTKSPTY